MRTHEPIAEASVRETVAQFIGRNSGEIPATADFSEDLGLDSLDRLDLMAEVEKQHHVYLSDEALSSISNLQDLLNALESEATGRR
jgi:acyl carrier protein